MRPVFLALDVEVFGDPRVVGRDHLKLKLRQDGVVFDAIGFNLGSRLDRIAGSGTRVDALFTIEENNWNGNVFTQLKLKDLRPAGEGRTREEIVAPTAAMEQETGFSS
jgi:single-stranded-DNA-specific exonuclease